MRRHLLAPQFFDLTAENLQTGLQIIQREFQGPQHQAQAQDHVRDDVRRLATDCFAKESLLFIGQDMQQMLFNLGHAATGPKADVAADAPSQPVLGGNR